MAQKIFVNLVKRKRAEDIVKLIDGTLTPKSDAEIDTKTKFASLLQDEGIKTSSVDEAVEFVYVKLGGLLRDYAEAPKEVPAKGRGGKKAPTSDDEDEDDDD